MSEDLSAVTDAEWVLVDAGDYHGDGICEAPVWHPEGYFTFVRHRLNLLFKWDPVTGESKVIRENTGRMTGCVLDPDGRLVCAEGNNRRITRTDPGAFGGRPADEWPREPAVVANGWRGKSFCKPNDIICRSDGLIYFTDPNDLKPGTTEFSGVYTISPGGELRLATDECEFPNGLAFSPDESVLYVAITRLPGSGCKEEAVCPHRKVRAFDVAADGTLSNNRVFADLTYEVAGGPDGMKVDSDGRVYCTSGGGVWVYAPDGHLLGIITTPGKPRNVAFGGPDYSTLFVCSGEEILSRGMKVKGIPSLVG
jgi:gluconolactonase